MSLLQKEEIVKIVARVREADDYGACLREIRVLQSRGKGIVDTVLEEIFRLKESGVLAWRNNFSFYCLLVSIEPYVEPRHEKQLAGILLWGEVALTEDGSKRFQLFEMLRRIGSAEAILCLEQLSVKVEGIMYRDYYDPRIASPEAMRELDQKEIRQTIDAIRSRNTA